MKKPFVNVLLSSVLLASLLPSMTAGAAEPQSGSIAAYESNSLIKTDGTYWTWGGINNTSVPTQLHEITDVSALFSYNFFKKADGSLWHWRNTGLASLALVQIEGIVDPIDVLYYYPEDSSYHALVLDAAGKLHRVGYSDYINVVGSSEVLDGIDGVKEMTAYQDDAASASILVFLKSDGTVWRSDTTLTRFVQAKEITAAEHIQADGILMKDGSVREWGSSYSATSSTSASAWESVPSVVNQGLTSRAIKLWKNGRTSLAIDDKNRLWFWGATITGWSDSTSYNNQPKPILLTGIQNVTEAYVAERSVIALTQSGKVYSASIQNQTMPANAEFELIATDVRSIKAGTRHVIMQKNDGTLWGWGVNKNAELGGGDYEFEHLTSVQVQSPIEVVLNGESIALSNGVITRSGQAFIPLRSVFEKLGAQISWDADSKVATLERAATEDRSSVKIQLNFMSGTMTLNGTAVKLENELFSASGSSYLPLRFISESLGAKVDWQQKEGKISITMQ